MTNELSILTILWVLMRVAIVIAVWLVLFLTVFLGFLTIPIVIVFLFLVVYTMVDLRRAFMRLLGRQGATRTR